eukprot:751832-Hanusia_phi.AAC.4
MRKASRKSDREMYVPASHSATSSSSFIPFSYPPLLHPFPDPPLPPDCPPPLFSSSPSFLPPLLLSSSPPFSPPLPLLLSSSSFPSSSSSLLTKVRERRCSCRRRVRGRDVADEPDLSQRDALGDVDRSLQAGRVRAVADGDGGRVGERVGVVEAGDGDEDGGSVGATDEDGVQLTVTKGAGGLLGEERCLCSGRVPDLGCRGLVEEDDAIDGSRHNLQLTGRGEGDGGRLAEEVEGGGEGEEISASLVDDQVGEGGNSVGGEPAERASGRGAVAADVQVALETLTARLSAAGVVVDGERRLQRRVRARGGDGNNFEVDSDVRIGHNHLVVVEHVQRRRRLHCHPGLQCSPAGGDVGRVPELSHGSLRQILSCARVAEGDSPQR